jgi:hypothetical protein
MKRLLVLITTMVFMLGMASLGLAATDKCNKCHPGAKSVDKSVKAKKIATAADLKKAIRTGPKAGLHKAMTDADIAAEAKALKLKAN